MEAYTIIGQNGAKPERGIETYRWLALQQVSP